MAYTPRPFSQYRSVKKPGFSDAFGTTMGQALASAIGTTLGSGASYLTQRGLETLTNDPSLRQREAAADLARTQATSENMKLEDYGQLRAGDIAAKGSKNELDLLTNLYKQRLLRETGDEKIAAAGARAIKDKAEAQYGAGLLGVTDEQMGVPVGTVADRLLSQRGMNEQITAGLTQDATRSGTELNRRQVEGFNERFLLGSEAQSLADRTQAFDEWYKKSLLGLRQRDAAAAAANRGKQNAEKQVGAALGDFDSMLDGITGQMIEVTNEDGSKKKVLPEPARARLNMGFTNAWGIIGQAANDPTIDPKLRLRAQALMKTMQPYVRTSGGGIELKPEFYEIGTEGAPKGDAIGGMLKMAKAALGVAKDVMSIRSMGAGIDRDKTQAEVNKAYERRLSLIEGVDAAATEAKEKKDKKGKKEPALKPGGGKGLNATMSEFGEGE